MQKFFLNSIQYKVLKVIPNLLTIFRFFLVYPIVLFILDNNFLWAIFLYILAAITDFFDGLIARKFDLISEFGKIADPISDKTLILGALISLSLIGEIDSIMAFIILGRDVFVIVGFILASLLVKDYEVRPHFSGKLNALFLMVYLGLIIINASGFFILREIIFFLEILLIITIILSIYNYLKYPGRAVFKQIF
tara:strand:- start:251 stop:832 length:582 start_codon:yes stop_codon:yes gene_type:complete